jgi:transposase-like protein
MAPKSRPPRKRKTRSYTEEQKHEALELYKTDGPTVVYQRLGIPKSTINSWARAAGARTVRNKKTEDATRATEVDAAMLRAEASSFAVQGARAAFQKLYERISSDDGEISFKDLGIVAGILADKHLAFIQVDDDGGTQDTVSLLDKLAEQIGGDLDAE